MEIWSRTEHIYQSTIVWDNAGSQYWSRQPRYSVEWVNAGMVFGGVAASCYILTLWIFPSKDK